MSATEKAALASELQDTEANAAQAADNDNAVQPKSDVHNEFGFASPRSVEGMLTDTAERQRRGLLTRFRERKEQYAARTGLSYGFDSNMHYLDTDSDNAPSDAASNVTRLYGSWTPAGLATPQAGALVFKIEYRTAVSSHVPTQELGSLIGYAGTLATGYSDAGAVLTNLFWHQGFAGGRGRFVIGQVDTSDYVDVNNIASPWNGFTNLAFEQQATFAGPPQGLGAAVQWRLNNNWAVLGGFADSNADPSEPWNSAKTLFDTGETFKHLALGWSPDWSDRFDQLVQMTIWQIDRSTEAGKDGGHGVSFAASMRIRGWRQFLRGGYAEDAGVPLRGAISVGTSYDARDGHDLAGLGVSWGRAPNSSRDQFSLEAFYRYDVTGFIQLTPVIQIVVNPAREPEADRILVLGARLRAHF